MIYDKYAEAWDTQNIKMLASLCHPNFEMVMHSSGTIVRKSRLYRTPRTANPKVQTRKQAVSL